MYCLRSFFLECVYLVCYFKYGWFIFRWKVFLVLNLFELYINFNFFILRRNVGRKIWGV